MNTFTATASKEIKKNSVSLSLSGILHKTGEFLWFTTSLLLFLALGPFSAIAALIGLFSLASEKNRSNMQEPASC